MQKSSRAYGTQFKTLQKAVAACNARSRGGPLEGAVLRVCAGGPHGRREPEHPSAGAGLAGLDLRPLDVHDRALGVRVRGGRCGRGRARGRDPAVPGCDRGAVRGRPRRSLPAREGAVRGRDPAHAADAGRRARRLLVGSAARRLLPGGGREPRRDRLPPAPGSAPARAFVLARGAHRRESRLRHDRERRHLRRAGPGRAAPRDDEHRDGLRGDRRDLRVRDLPRRPDPSAEARGGEGGEDERGHRGAGRVPDDRGGRQLAADHRALRRTDARRGGAQRPARRHRRSSSSTSASQGSASWRPRSGSVG